MDCFAVEFDIIAGTPVVKLGASEQTVRASYVVGWVEEAMSPRDAAVHGTRT